MNNNSKVGEKYELWQEEAYNKNSCDCMCCINCWLGCIVSCCSIIVIVQN